MRLTSEIQKLLIDAELPEGESMEDIVLDAEEYGMECMIELVTADLSADDVMALEEMIENDTPVAQMDEWLATRAKNYEEHLKRAMQEVKIYLSGDDEEDDDADLPADEDEA